MNIPRAVLNLPRAVTDYVRGVNSKIPYVINVPSGNWSQWRGTYEPQKYKFDTNECSQLAGVNTAETICNWLKAQGKFSPEALKWFTDNGYFDQDGSFAFSERFAGIMSGTTIRGNSSWYFWVAMDKYGFLPRKDLAYTYAQSAVFSTPEDMCNDYYNPKVVTQAMKDKALESQKYLKVSYEWLNELNSYNQIPTNDLVAALKQSPLQISVPVCLPGWNNPSVPLCSRVATDHSIELYAANPDGSWVIRDHYEPADKTLPANYLIPQAIKGVITVVDLPPTPPASLVVDANKSPNQEELNYFSAVLVWLGKQVQRLWK